MTMTFTSSQTAPLSLSAETYAALDRRDELIDRTGTFARPTGHVRLLVGDDLTAEDRERVEYQLRVDGGLWRNWRKAQPDGTIVFEDAHLIAPGAHHVEVRSRYAGHYTTLDPTPVKMRAVVDPFGPSLSAKLEDEVAAIRVVDDETPADEPLFLRGRVDGGAWFDVPLERIEGDLEGACAAKVYLRDVAGGQKLELQASDPRGNESAIAMVRLPLAGEEVAENEGGGCACHETGTTHAHNEALTLGIALAVFVLALRPWRKRRSSTARSS
jgi:hypothetical protein